MPINPDAVAFQNAALDALWGADRAVGMPSTFELGLLTDDPRLGGVEITGDGYGRLLCDNDGTFWLSASDGEKRSLVQTFGPATGPWDDALFEGIWVDGVLVDFGRLDEPVVATGVNESPEVRVVRRFAAPLV